MAIFLDNILKAIHNSVIEAQKISEQQHMRALGRYFYLDKNEEIMEYEGVTIDDLGMPKNVDVKLPFIEENELKYHDVQIPLIALSPPSSIKIKNLKVSFEARITGVDESQKREKGFFKFFKSKDGSRQLEKKDDNSSKGPIKVDFSGDNKNAGVAKIEIEFENSDVPETFARINDHIVKTFPF
ncbi:DUF2589 domain-containing protein [Halarcobacter ebronensis]|uniref:DUF2589 domain-containing protein n=1 Tax=Halarcobacter ebronensis TaxID=1462615 RepID=A0A4Q1AR11_9BACT|nr:DUF2589 domain-containing protein [Halarcobacter ebronensis]QKF82418.1 DUF2589 domain-containing protein [Halarcobacter ebronensis]RXK07559.1 hypothetical protein CRV07_03610 [Halarcobacter ebronensis]